MKRYFLNILRDKQGNFSLRETVVAIFVLVTLVAWAGEQFFGMACPEYMFYGFISLVAAGCFGYSIERRHFFTNQKKNKNANTKTEI